MPKVLSAAEVARYHRDGFSHFPVPVLSTAEARVLSRPAGGNRSARWAGRSAGNMRHKPHLLFTWANELARHPKILDAVEDVIGPDILCWSTTFFTKEAHSPSFVSWHQDATYWGLSTNDVITAWVAFADAPVESGAMKFWPGSHLKNQIEHRDTFASDNLLTRGQEIAVDVPAGEGVDVRAQGRRDVAAPCAAGARLGPQHDRRPAHRLRHPLHPAPCPPDQGARFRRCWCAAPTATAISTPSPRRERDLDEAALAAHHDAVERSAKALYDGTDGRSFRA